MEIRLALTIVLIVSLNTGAPASGRFAYGLGAMEQPELLPFLAPNGTQTKQFISYDTSGGNNDGGIERFRRYDENGEYVFFDEIGPGCLYRQQMNVFIRLKGFPAEEARIRMYFDGEKDPRLDMTFAEFFGKGQKYSSPFTPPLAHFDLVHGRGYFGQGGAFAVLYYPFPFQKRLKITAYRPGGLGSYGGDQWYQYTYHKYRSGTRVISWPGRHLDSQAVRAQWDRVGEDPKPPAGNQTVSRTVSVAKGKTVRVLNLKGAGSISRLKITLAPWTLETLFQTDLRIAWDDNAPAVEMPLACFFGAGGDLIGAGDVSTRSLQTLLFGFDAKARTLYSYWPMPFWSRARIDIVNRGSTDIAEMQLAVALKPASAQSYPRDSCGHFYAKRTVDISPDEAYYSRTFRVHGRGKVMGHMMYSKDYAMDGDEFTYIDDSRTPQIHGDGTEDDHNQGWGGYNVQKPLWGGIFNGFNGGYRLYLNDSYVFNSSITIKYEHSNAAFFRPEPKTDCIVWYYLADPGFGNLKLTDELDVGNAASERAHAYMVSGQSWSGTTSASYDKCEQGDPYPTTDDGRAFTGHSRFTAKIDPRNEGVRLRRRTNRHFSNVQLANVYVDGTRIPDTPWYVCDLPAPEETAFLDTDFEIPAAYSKGKDHLTIKVEHVSGQEADSSNEYHYWVYCYGKTPLPPQPPEEPAVGQDRAVAIGLR